MEHLAGRVVGFQKPKEVLGVRSARLRSWERSWMECSFMVTSVTPISRPRPFAGTGLAAIGLRSSHVHGLELTSVTSDGYAAIIHRYCGVVLRPAIGGRRGPSVRPQGARRWCGV